MNEKKGKILKIIDFLIGIEIMGKTVLTQNQIYSFQEYKKVLDKVKDEEKLDLVLHNIISTINRLSKQIVVYGRNISIEQRKFLEKVDQFENQTEINQFISLL